MATSREHFALDWIKGELLETLNTARAGLESYAEALEIGDAADTDEAARALRECVNGLHQVHGTLVMLELKGVTRLADHLERLADHVLSGEAVDVSGACQSLMQGILELPGYLEELQSGVPDSDASMLPLINELRAHLGESPVERAVSSIRLFGTADELSVKRFEAIDGVGKTRKIRAVYQQVLLSLLKGGDLAQATDTLRKVAQGLMRVCEGTQFAGQWHAFNEFVEGLAASPSAGGPLEPDAVKLLRRVDSEIRELATSGSETLKRPVSIPLVRQLLDAARERGRTSKLLDELTESASQGESSSDSLSFSGREAMVSAAGALREELGTIKDRLDLYTRQGDDGTEVLADLLAPLKQIGSTLSLLGFESSNSIVMDQVDALNDLVEGGQADEASVMNIAHALVQVDENLASLTQSGKGEVEKITDEAQRAVAQQTREGLDRVKQSIVDYVSSQWDVRHLQETPAELDSIVGALNMIPLAQAAGMVGRCQDYLRLQLMAGHVPSWEELDRLADALSGIDYYLERLASDSPGGAEDVLDVVQRSLEGLAARTGTAADQPVAGPREQAAEPPPQETAQPPAQPSGGTVEPLFGGAEHVDVSAVGAQAEEEPELEHEAAEDFDLDNALFDDISSAGPRADQGAARQGAARQGAAREGTDREGAAGQEETWELEIESGPEETADAAAPGDADADPLGAAVDDLAGSSSEAGQSARPAPAPQPAAARPPPSLVDNFESDDEIVEIFVEEVDEVLGTVDEHLEGWSAALTDETHQTEIRRAFHTLKGSGRMVGANVLGEMAWSVENMLNRVLDDTVAPTAEFVTVVRDARALIPELKTAFESKAAPEMSGVGRIMENADVLASGGTLAEASEGPAAERASEEAAGAAAPDDDRHLFVTEAESHLTRLQAACGDGTFTLDDDCMRALHTLSGSAAMAGVTQVSELVSPAYELAQALRRRGRAALDSEAAAFFVQVTRAVADMVQTVRAGGEPEPQDQLMADADRLLMDAQSAGSGASSLLGLPALGTIMKAGELLDGWRDGAMDMSLADDVREALADVERAAREEGQGALTALASALLGAHERFEFESLGDAAHRILSQGHETLLTQLDALAADQTPADARPVCQALNELQPGAADEQLVTAEPVEPESSYGADEEEATGDDGLGGVDEPAAGDFVLDLDADALPDAENPVEPAAEAPESHPADEPVELPGIEELSEVETPGDAGKAPVAAGRRPREAGAAGVEEGLLPEEVDEEIIGVFFEEADEILESLDQAISEWAEAPENLLHLETLLRGLHTLKGGARLSGLTLLGDQTHAFESYVIEFQEDGRTADAALFEGLHQWYDDIAALLARIKAALAGKPLPPQSAPGPAPGAGAETPQPASSGKPAEADAPPPVADTAQPPTPEPEPPPDNVAPLRPAAEAPKPESSPAESRPEAASAQSRAAQEMVRVGAGLLENLVNLAGESSIIRARVEQGMSDFTSALDEMETTIERLREQLRRLEIETETQVLFRQERTDGPAYEDFDPLEMDRYSQLQQLSRGLGESASDMLDLKETLLYKAREAETLLLQQARVNTELQEGLMRSRMVPFSRLLPRLKRTVRQVAKEVDKKVSLNAFNVEGELDRTLLERMVPPLEHMLRNAVDHGIESPKERGSKGKAEAGRIDLRLSREGGDVVIEISDDGAGIETERVRAKAIERGLMSADAALRDDEINQFVLAPGFSTAESVTQISGRGVGMDVVASEVKQLGGSIDIFSQPGQGTRFVVRVPFTVSVNRALMVSVGDDLYAIPLNTIEGIVLLAPDELEELYGPNGKTFDYAGVPYRVQYLGAFLGREYHSRPMQGSVPVVLVRSGEHAVAVHVDEVQGSREIVVKSLGPQFAGVGGISGATILGDGSVVVILDLVALIRTRSSGEALGQRRLTGAARTRSVMVVDDSVTVRKVTSRLLERQGMDVIVAKDGVEAVSLLQERRPDVMLLDIEMPRMDGFEVLRQVRHDERLKDLPIVMISSRTGAKHQDRAAELGVSRFLGKPFQESELLATIDELVN